MMHHKEHEQLQGQQLRHQSQWQMVKPQPAVHHLRSKELDDKTKTQSEKVLSKIKNDKQPTITHKHNTR